MSRRSLLIVASVLISPFFGVKSGAEPLSADLPVLEIEYVKDLSLIRTFSEMVAHFGSDRSADNWSVLLTKKDQTEPRPLISVSRHEPRAHHLNWLAEKLHALEVCVQKKICPADAPVQPAMDADTREIAFYRSSTDLSALLKEGFMFEVKTTGGILFLFEGLGTLALSPDEQLFISWAKN